MNKDYIIGLDLGINNVGWSIIDNSTKKIEKCGVRLFPTSNDASERRSIRNGRRRLKRKDNRIQDVLKLFQKIHFPNSQTIDTKLIEKRYFGIRQKIEKQDIVNILCYLVSHRGYIPFNDEEVNFVSLDGKLPCEYYYDLYQKIGKYRALNCTVKNKDLEKEIETLLEKQSIYYPELKDIHQGILIIFNRKRKFWEGPGSIQQLTPYGRFQTPEQVEEYLYNKEKNPNYEKYLFEDLIGKCKIAIGEKCAPKANFYAEQFDFLNDFINISISKPEKLISQDSVYLDMGTKKYKFTQDSLNMIFEYCISNSKVVVKNMLKKLFGLNIEDIDNYRVNKKGEPEFSTMKSYRIILKILEDNNLETEWLENIEEYNRIIYYLTVAPGIVEITKMIDFDDKIEYCFSEQEKECLKQIHDKLSKDGILNYHSLSEKALKRAIQDMLSYQMNFMQVRKKFDYDKEAREYFSKNYSDSCDGMPHINSKFVEKLIASPQVKKTLRQAIKVINAIIDEKKELPKVIVIESTKEMNGKEKKVELNRMQQKQEKLRTEAKQEISYLYGDENVTEVNIEKVMLFHEINGQCPYCNHPIQLDDVMNNRIEIEHILPRSKSFDNSYNNKTLACSNCNKEKNNRTPYQYLMPLGNYDYYKKRIQSLQKISDFKRENFLFEGDIDKYKTRFFNRNLRDTAYATSALVEQIQLFNNYLKLNYNNTQVLTLSTPGQLTSNIRKQQNLEKDRDDGKYHHAVDASIIALIATTQLGKILIDSQNNPKFWRFYKNVFSGIENYLYHFNLANYNEQLKEIDSDEKIKISSQIQKNPQKKLANANIYKVFKKEDKYYRIDQIDNIYKADFSKNDTIKQFDKLFDENDSNVTLLCQDNNMDLFNYLKEIYQTRIAKENPFVSYCREYHNLDSDKDFDYLKHGIHVPSKKGNSPVIVKLRYYTTITSPYLIQKESIHKKESTLLAYDCLAQYCTQVFMDLEKNKFVFLPIFCISVDLKSGKLKENDSFYKTLYEKYIQNKKVKYVASLYNGNYLEIEKKNGTIIKGEYQGFHKTNNVIILKNNVYFTTSDLSISIFDIDVLGNKKKRLTFSVKDCILKM